MKNDIFERSPELLSVLLKDQTLSTEECQVNIFWATNNYAKDFSKSWTDAELYAKYNLSADEIAFIESMIKPME